MSTCPTCKVEYRVFKDADNTRYRRPCPCEVTNTCHSCKRGKISQAVLGGDGEVAYYACSAHGLEDAAAWAPLEAPASPKDSKTTRAAKAAQAAPVALASVYPIEWTRSELYFATCRGCQVSWATTEDKPPRRCPACGSDVYDLLPEQGAVDLRAVAGPLRTVWTLIVTTPAGVDPGALLVKPLLSKTGDAESYGVKKGGRDGS